MAESFEAGLMKAGSKENFKKAKHILHHGGLLCCMEFVPGVLRAVCRDGDGTIHRCEVTGFPRGPWHGTCSCADSGTICCHGVAAALYHAKYTIKYKEKEVVEDAPTQYAGLRFAALPELIGRMLETPTAFLYLDAKTEFPHLPSKWERVPLSVTLRTAKREYIGNLNNLRHLYFEKSLVASLALREFPLQDQQIIRFLAINAMQDGQDLTLDAEQCAEFFHCLPGFQRFTRFGEPVAIHRDSAEPLLLVEKLEEKKYLLRSAIAVENVPLPLEKDKAKVITGRSGCWVGMLGEYWWIPAQTDVNWLRAFLCTSLQICDSQTAQSLLDAKDGELPVRIVPARGCKVRQKKFQTLYDGFLDPEGVLHLKILFDYGGRLCKADEMRLASSGDGKFWRRNTKKEFETVQELLNFGFRKEEKSRQKDGVKLVLAEREAIGMFADELIPKWLREKRSCLLSSGLASLAGSFSDVTLRCRVIAAEPLRFRMEFALAGAGEPLRWKNLVSAVKRNEYFMPGSTDDSLVKLPSAVRALANAFADIASLLPKEDSMPDSDILEIPRSTAVQWAVLGAEMPGAVPVEFLRMKVDLEQLRAQMEDAGDTVPELFHGTLRHYQAAGVKWISGMFRRDCNLILADEMGLGKTVQTLAALVMNPELTLPALVICPTSLTANWRRETERFTPSLRVEVIAGNARGELWKQSRSADIVVCSYSIIKRDMRYVQDRPFRTLVLDEAQHIKNPASANAVTCKQIRADHKLVLTGTPLENSAGDLWSIFDFLHPGFLGPLTLFRGKYHDATVEQRQELAGRIAPYMLRRKKAEVCLELPAKQEQTLFCEMTSAQRELYGKLTAEAAERCRLLRNENAKLAGMDLLAALMRLRMTCCDPALLPKEFLLSDGAVPDSAKTELLREVLLQSLDSGHKILVFSQFVGMLKIIRAWLEEQNIPYQYLDGSTKDRQERVDAFNQSPEYPVFLLSLKAGGVGLNLTAADTVIICDPWWNPAAEDQAADRTHRIGQTKNVNCIRLAVKDSIEERVLTLQKKKRELFQSLVEDAGSASGVLTLEDFEFLLGKE